MVERIIKILKNLGLTPPEAEIYIFLARNGPKAKQEIEIGTRIIENQLNRDLISLQEKGFINSNAKEEIIFSAIPFERVIDGLIQTRLDEAGQLIKEKEFF
jgi:sugar-specific transcriptional regulator TrmB